MAETVRADIDFLIDDLSGTKPCRDRQELYETIVFSFADNRFSQCSQIGIIFQIGRDAGQLLYAFGNREMVPFSIQVRRLHNNSFDQIERSRARYTDSDNIFVTGLKALHYSSKLA